MGRQKVRRPAAAPGEVILEEENPVTPAHPVPDEDMLPLGDGSAPGD
ncbi:hypothetical protein [Streptomyces sp. NPDC096934]